MDSILINHFQAAVPQEHIVTDKMEHDFITKALSRGYIVEKELLCQHDVEEFLDDLHINPNATFYKTFGAVITKDRFELLIDQLMHYASTYGTDYQGNTFILNDTFGKDIDIDFSKLKVIKAIDKQTMFEMCKEQIYSGIAMKNDLTKALCDYIISVYKETGWHLDINKVKNHEAQAILALQTNLFPSNGIDILRIIIYRITGSAMIIKSPEVINLIQCANGMDLSGLDESVLVELSRIFYRFKPIFLALRKANRNNRGVVNKIRKLAIKNHKPMFKDPLTNLFDMSIPRSAKIKAIDNSTIFTKIRILNMVRETMANYNMETTKAYVIRNQKVFFKSGVNDTNWNKNRFCQELESYIIGSLTSSLQGRGCVVKYPKNYELAAPVSQKAFVGDLPFGTSYTLTNDNFIGCYWRNEWGTRDFDLSMVASDGSTKYGWNAGYYNEQRNIIYSGDMTNANPEAAEVIYISGINTPDGFIYINRYNGEHGSKFKLFLAQETGVNTRDIKNNYMVNPGAIQMQTMCESDSQQQLVGIIHNGKVYITTLGVGYNRVSGTRYTQEMFDAMVSNVSHRVTLREILDNAGFIDYDRLDEANKEMVDNDPEVPVLDLTNISAAELIGLLS